MNIISGLRRLFCFHTWRNDYGRCTDPDDYVDYQIILKAANLFGRKVMYCRKCGKRKLAQFGTPEDVAQIE